MSIDRPVPAPIEIGVLLCPHIQPSNQIAITHTEDECRNLLDIGCKNRSFLRHTNNKGRGEKRGKKIHMAL